jgi:hypothetical protein
LIAPQAWAWRRVTEAFWQNGLSTVDDDKVLGMHLGEVFPCLTLLNIVPAFI